MKQKLIKGITYLLKFNYRIDRKMLKVVNYAKPHPQEEFLSGMQRKQKSKEVVQG